MRLTFPQDRATFVYQQPLQPILTPGRTGIEFYSDPAGAHPADMLRPDDLTPITDSIVYTGADGLVPEFLGPDGVTRLYAQVVGTVGLYAVEARFTDVLQTVVAARSLVSGHGAPDPDEGIVGGFYLDEDTHQMWGPKVDETSWPNQPFQLGSTGQDAPVSWQYPLPVPVTEVTVDHPMSYPSVVYLNTEDVAELCDVAYPSPSRVVVGFGSPSTGRLLFT